MFEETPKEKLNNLFKMMESKGPEILKQDPYYEYYKVAQRAKEQGLIRKKTQEEIDEELKKKPWLKVNKIIRKNEAIQDADTTL